MTGVNKAGAARLRTVATAAVAALGLAGSAQAGVVLDQANLDMSVGLNGLDIQWQQEVTAGLSGRLAGVTLWGVGTARVRIAEGDAFHEGPFQFDQVIALGPGGTYVDLLPASIRLTAGDSFVIDLTESTNGYGGAAGAYAGGDLWLDDAFGRLNYTDAQNVSLRFESHMAVPEPGTWALMILGFGAAGGALRRRAAVAA
ncbi:MAG: PEPxxWA-CTERM sorting domain-containing protein [Pseudomonadota bacterium]